MTLPTKYQCFICGEHTYFDHGDFAIQPGHIYSLAGLREWDISQTCEYCFDEITKEDYLD